MTTGETVPTAPAALMEFMKGSLNGAGIEHTRKTLGEIRSLFLHGDESPLPDGHEIYAVEWLSTGTPWKEGALLFGSTTLHAGTVGGEYFMTHGHIHRNRTRDELYFAVSGQGILLLMEECGRTWAQPMGAGSVHTIQGVHAHRVVNTGPDALVFWACWSADAGYDYAAVRERGFGLRVFDRDGFPVLKERDAAEGAGL